MLLKIKNYIGRLIRICISRLSTPDDTLLTFIPHGGCEIDGYSILNHRSDSALTFFRYVAENYGAKYRYQIAGGQNEQDRLKQIVKDFFPELKIKVIVHPNFESSLKTCKQLAKSSYIFTSEAIPFDYVSKKQKIYFLGYYAGNFKNDIDVSSHYPSKFYNTAYTIYFSQSLLFSQINSLVYDVPLSKFRITGLVRNDNLLKPYSCPKLDDWIRKNVDYEVKKVFLYTPTHRDYEKNYATRRNILGFDIDANQLESFLSNNNAIIICKIHSNQNLMALENHLPKGLLIHQSNDKYGLTELLQRADYLITDYTSTYFDYLLLDRPVLFNFYDYEKYKNTRGFSFDPLDPILAGEKFSDQKSMIEKMHGVMQADSFKEQRKFVRDLLFKYQDSKASERVYNFVFNDQKATH